MNTQILRDIVKYPRKYDHVIDTPGQYDAAQTLYIQHANDLTTTEKRACEDILIRSAKWVRAFVDN